MRKVVSIAMVVLVAACAAQDRNTATLYDDPQYPLENTAVVGPAPDGVGKIVIKAAGGQPVQCGGWLSRTKCERVRLLPGTTVLRLDYAYSNDGRLATARDMDLPINVQAGHTYHIRATVVRDPAPAPVPGQSGARVVLQAIDMGKEQPQPQPAAQR